MTRQELRASLSLAAIYMLRMFGMFLILPVFAVLARDMPGATPGHGRGLPSVPMA